MSETDRLKTDLENRKQKRLNLGFPERKKTQDVVELKGDSKVESKVGGGGVGVADPFPQE